MKQTQNRRGYAIPSSAILTAAAAALAYLPAELRAQVTLTENSSTNWTITNGLMTVVFDPAGEEVTSIQLGVGAGVSANLLNGGGTKGSLNAEFDGTNFGTVGTTQIFNSSIGPNNSYVDVWTTIPSNTNASDPNPITYAFHYVIFANDPAVHVYETLSHAATDAPIDVVQGQFLFRSTPSLFPNLYQVATGPNNLASQTHLNVPSTNSNFTTVTGQAGRNVQDSTDDLTGSGIAGDNGTNFFTKYDYSTYTQFYQAETMYGSQYAVSEIDPSTDTLTGGPTKQVLAWTDPGILNMEFLSDHYGMDGAGSAYPGYGYTPTQGVATTKLFGPYTFRIASDTSETAAQINQDAINSIPTYQSLYSTDTELAASGYVSSPGRGGMQILAANSAGWSSNTANNTVVLSEPGVNFQESTQGYQYWAQLGSNGSAAITNAVPGTYRLSMYELGQWGETRVDGVQVQAGKVSIPQNLKFTPENFGTAAPIWAIGTPNRSANEFTNGHDSSVQLGSSGPDVREYYGAYNFWAEEQTLGTPGYISYNATATTISNVAEPATNDPNAWLANQWQTFDPGLYDASDKTTDEYNSLAPAYVNTGGGPASYHGAPWQVHFTVTPTQIAQGQFVVLSVGLAAQKADLTVTLNGHSEEWTQAGFDVDDPSTRSGDAGFYQWAAFQFPTTDLNAAGSDDEFTFSVDTTDGVMYDALRMEITNTSANPSVTGWSDYNYINGATDTVQNDALSQTGVNSFSPLAGTWSATSGGTWGTSTNWQNSSIPALASTIANFTSAITTPSTVNLNSNWTVGTVNFNNVNSYTIASGTGGMLTLDNGTSLATINDSGGTHFITAPVGLNSNVLVTVTNPGDALTLSGPISGSGGVTTAGSGMVTLSGSNSYTGPTAVNTGLLLIGARNSLPSTTSLTIGTTSTTGTTQLSASTGASTVSALSVHTGSTLDITNNALVINYATPAADPVTAIAALLASGAAFNGSENTWTGTGITSSAAAGSNGKFAVGYLDGNLASDNTTNNPIAPNAIIIKYTLTGDAFLEGSVGFDDLLTVAQNYGGAGKDWAQGSFDYTGLVGFGDLLSVAQNYGQSSGVSDGAPGGDILSLAWQGSASAVPEPTSIAVFALAGTLLRRRRITRSSKRQIR